jgi:hypothetical protein
MTPEGLSRPMFGEAALVTQLKHGTPVLLAPITVKTFKINGVETAASEFSANTTLAVLPSNGSTGRVTVADWAHRETPHAASKAKYPKLFNMVFYLTHVA